MLVLLTAGCSLAAPRTTPRPSATIVPATGFIGIRTLQLVDTTRPTNADRRGGVVSGSRALPTTVWYPAERPGGTAGAPQKAGAPFALVVFSHGLRGTPGDYARLLQSWAAAGYVVAAPTFPLTSTSADPIVPADVDSQPGDVSFVITSLLKLADDRSDPFFGFIDAKRVLAAGHSEGAITTGGLFASCCAEDRLAGAIILAGNDVGMPGRPFVAKPKPVLFIHGDDDRIVPYQTGQRLYAAAPEPKAFITLVGAGHVEPYVRDASGPAGDVVRDATLAFLAYVVGSDPAKARRDLITAGTRSGVSRLDAHLP